MTGPGEVFGTCYHGDLAGKGRKLWLEARHGLRRHSRRRWLWWWEQADKLALSEMTRSSKPNIPQHNQVFNHFLSAQTLWEGVTAGGTEQASLPFFTSACWTRSVFVSVRWRKGDVKAGFCDLLADVRLSVRPVPAHICVCQPWSKGQTPTDHKPAAQKQQHIFFCGVFIWLSKHLCTIIFSTCFSDINQSFNWLRNHLFYVSFNRRETSAQLLLMRIRGSYAVCVRNVEIELH